MEKFVDRAGLSVSESLARFVEDRAISGIDIAAEDFWRGTAAIFATLTPENRALLKKRDALQAEIDEWLKARRGQPLDAGAYQDFLRHIGYLVPDPPPFKIGVENVDEELALVAGPQLVVPILNARFLLNAANARWGSLYDALYGTDVIAGAPSGNSYDPKRGAEVIAWARAFLDRAAPLASGRHANVQAYQIKDGALSPALADPSLFVGYKGDPSAPSRVLLRHHGLLIELKIDRGSTI
jgi:malate synthase